MALPEAEGGLGADVLTALQVIEEVARADGSTGWCLAMAINTFRQSAQLAPDVRRELFFSDPIGLSAGSARERGRAVAVPGGYRVTGHWFFASGCMHSHLLHGACKVFDGDAPRLRPNGDQDVRIAFFYPKSTVRIVDTWNVSGLRGTGSHDIVVDDLFVPEERTFSAMDRRARVTGPMNRMHGFDLAGCGFCCVGLGVARAAIDAFVELATAKIPRSSSDLLRERVMVQAQVGEAEALLRAGRALLFDVVEEMWELAKAKEAISERLRSDLRLAMTHAAQSAARATHMVCVCAGHHVDLRQQPAGALRARRRGRHPSQPAAVRELRGRRPHAAWGSNPTVRCSEYDVATRSVQEDAMTQRRVSVTFALALLVIAAPRDDALAPRSPCRVTTTRCCS